MEPIDKVKEMISGLDHRLKSINYNYFECNYFPQKLISGNHLVNVFVRLFFRLSTVNFRRKEVSYPSAPQSLIALLKAYNVSGDKDALSCLVPKLLALQCPKTKNFSLSQGIYIATQLYKNDSLDPTPLNTVWFGQFILDDQCEIFTVDDKRKLLLSISDYLIDELGYRDHNDNGIYFYYGPTLKKEIYNASALISAFLLRVGNEYDVNNYKILGEAGIRYILYKQNNDGSWFYSEDVKKIVDNFHQSYILQALFQIKQYMPSLPINIAIEKGVDYNKNSLFKYTNNYVIPIRYDKRYIPKNTWILQKMDGRDLAEALVLFSKYIYDKKILDGLISFMYDRLYNRKGYIASEIMIYGKNNIPYLEFQGWYLYAMETVKKYYK